jgi:hypothetical protein
MNTLHNNAINAYAEFLKAGTSYAHAMRAVAKSLGGTPCPTLLAGLAKVHAEKYECNYTWDGKGRAVFYTGKESTRETRHDAARKSWSRNVMVWFTPEKPQAPASHTRVSKVHRDAAMDFLAHFEGKTLAEQIKQAKAILAAL